MMTGTSSNRVSPALEFSLDKLFLGKKQQFYGGHKFQTNLNFETRLTPYIHNTSWCYDRIAFYCVSKWFGSYKLRKIAVSWEVTTIDRNFSLSTALDTQFEHVFAIIGQSNLV